MKFNYTLAEGASVGVYGRRNGIPTHTRYDFVEILDTRKKDKSKRSAKVIKLLQYFYSKKDDLYCIRFNKLINVPTLITFNIIKCLVW